MISAANAGEALQVIATRLLEHGIVQSEGFAEISRVGQTLRALREQTSWRIDVDRGKPIQFERCTDKDGKPISLRLVSAGIAVDQSDEARLPFLALDVAIEIEDELNKPISRWHLDLANEAGGLPQSGPLVHLQYGGHHHDAREYDHPLKVPRWCHPPMEIALLCEVVSANFFEEKWLSFREDANWCRSIHLFQTLCFTAYFGKMASCAATSSTTALNQMWASNWR
jgi:hypothetical protein